MIGLMELKSLPSSGSQESGKSVRDVQDSARSPLPEKVRCTDEFCNALFPAESVHHCVVTNQPFCEYDYPIHVRGESYVERYRNGKVEIVTKPGCGPCTLHQEQQREGLK